MRKVASQMSEEMAMEERLRETADIHTSSEEYARRFSGASGAWMLGMQEQITKSLMAPFEHASILDVGGGHGQLAIPLCRAGLAVTVLGSDVSCGQRLAAVQAEGTCRFVTGDLLDMPFPENSFDVVLCFRLLTHCDRWPELVGQLCRVARRAVIVDYPTGQSLNCVAPALFGAKKKVEKNTRTFRLFSHREVAGAFAENGFRRTALRKQFFWPMVMHRMLKSVAVSRMAEGLCRGVGLTWLAGSPVIARFEPRPETQE